jgi:hypothetical protein
MTIRPSIAFTILLSTAILCGKGQSMRLQTGGLVEKATNGRLADIQILNKRTLGIVKSDALGLYKIMALAGDTLEISDSLYVTKTIIVSDFAFTKSSLEPWLVLREVIIRGNSLQANLNEVQGQFKSQGVFYTGRPHYYYLFLKPMTFIYENFKKEVKNARKFKKYAQRELDNNKITQRFNDLSIKALVNIKDSELYSFKVNYMPSLEQIGAWNDYDLNQYIIKSYNEFKEKH